MKYVYTFVIVCLSMNIQTMYTYATNTVHHVSRYLSYLYRFICPNIYLCVTIYHITMTRYICILIHMYDDLYTSMYLYAYESAYKQIQISEYKYKCIYTHIYVYMCTYMCECICVYIHTHESCIVDGIFVMYVYICGYVRIQTLVQIFA